MPYWPDEPHQLFHLAWSARKAFFSTQPLEPIQVCVVAKLVIAGTAMSGEAGAGGVPSDEGKRRNSPASRLVGTKQARFLQFIRGEILLDEMDVKSFWYYVDRGHEAFGLPHPHYKTNFPRRKWEIENLRIRFAIADGMIRDGRTTRGKIIREYAVEHELSIARRNAELRGRNPMSITIADVPRQHIEATIRRLDTACRRAGPLSRENMRQIRAGAARARRMLRSFTPEPQKDS
jgi:hypothetical protein